MNPLLTPHQVAEILGISARTVNELCNRRKLQFIQVDGKHRRFTEEMVREFIEGQTSQIKIAQRSFTGSAPRSDEQSATAIMRPTEESIEQLRKEIADL